ncbi:unnamed protein product [Caenorhabditis auriculariae]|uniref:Uncharacterized protein n=1 Tax=Caenorhabditis auriculariae TaxID=2777116 RepID=A0A8S1HE27_9PELO|nr:unnamed protein product [Caenorhabditis auriculariae]
MTYCFGAAGQTAIGRSNVEALLPSQHWTKRWLVGPIASRRPGTFGRVASGLALNMATRVRVRQAFPAKDSLLGFTDSRILGARRTETLDSPSEKPKVMPLKHLLPCCDEVGRENLTGLDFCKSL